MLKGKFQGEFISPSLAAIYLAKNVKNRKFKRSQIESMKADMAAGRFMETHQGVAFYKDGSLADGQNRLQAIIESGTGQEIWVFYGLDPEAGRYVDVGAKRSDADVIAIEEGLSGQNHVVAIARRMLASTASKDVFSRHQKFQFISDHREAIEFSARVTGKQRIVGSAPIRAVLARAWYTQHHDCVARFAQVMRDGYGETEDDSAAFRFAGFLGKSQNRGLLSGGSQQRAELYRRTEWSLDRFLRGIPVSVSKPSLECFRELFPIPGES